MGFQRLMVWLLIGVHVGYILAQGTTPVAPATTASVAPVATTTTDAASVATTTTDAALVATTTTDAASVATATTTVASVATTPTTVAQVATTPTTPTTTKRQAYNWTLAVIPTGPRVTPSTDGGLTYKGKMCIAGVNCTTVEIKGARNELATFAGAILGGSFLLGLMLCGIIIFVGLRNEAKLEARRATEQKNLSADTTEKKDTDVKLEEVVVEVPAVKEVKETVVEIPQAPAVQSSPSEVKPDEEPKQVPAVSEPEEKDNMPAEEPEPITVSEEMPEPVRKPEPEIQSQQNFGLKSDPELFPSASMRTASEDPESL